MSALALHPARFRAERVVGIDAGTHTGLAVWKTGEKRLMRVETLDFWSAYDAVQAYPKDTTLVVIENPAAIRGQYGRHVKAGRVGLNIAQKVGGVKRESELFAQGLERLGYVVVRVTPQGGKWDAATFQRITLWKGRTSSHARDASRLVVGHLG